MLLTDALRELGPGLVENCICGKVIVDFPQHGCPVHSMARFLIELHDYQVSRGLILSPAVRVLLAQHLDVEYDAMGYCCRCWCHLQLRPAARR